MRSEYSRIWIARLRPSAVASRNAAAVTSPPCAAPACARWRQLRHRGRRRYRVLHHLVQIAALCASRASVTCTSASDSAASRARSRAQAPSKPPGERRGGLLRDAFFSRRQPPPCSGGCTKAPRPLDYGTPSPAAPPAARARAARTGAAAPVRRSRARRGQPRRAVGSVEGGQRRQHLRACRLKACDARARSPCASDWRSAPSGQPGGSAPLRGGVAPAGRRPGAQASNAPTRLRGQAGPGVQLGQPLGRAPVAHRRMKVEHAAAGQRCARRRRRAAPRFAGPGAHAFAQHQLHAAAPRRAPAYHGGRRQHATVPSCSPGPGACTGVPLLSGFFTRPEFERRVQPVGGQRRAAPPATGRAPILLLDAGERERAALAGMRVRHRLVLRVQAAHAHGCDRRAPGAASSPTATRPACTVPETTVPTPPSVNTRSTASRKARSSRRRGRARLRTGVRAEAPGPGRWRPDSEHRRAGQRAAFHQGLRLGHHGGEPRRVGAVALVTTTAPFAKAQQRQHRQVLARLRHRAVVGGHQQQRVVDAGGAGDHGVHQAFVAGHVDGNQCASLPGPGCVERRSPARC